MSPPLCRPVGTLVHSVRSHSPRSACQPFRLFWGEWECRAFFSTYLWLPCRCISMFSIIGEMPVITTAISGFPSGARRVSRWYGDQADDRCDRGPSQDPRRDPFQVTCILWQYTLIISILSYSFLYWTQYVIMPKRRWPVKIPVDLSKTVSLFCSQ